ncbi:MAG: ferritin-like domain-containing protein [Myxococcota bacterium]|nr:ferritin-like domain-containing protein [Myxococcota bacterium]
MEHKISALLGSYILLLTTGCLEKPVEDSSYCLNVTEEEECPALDELNETVFPTEDCAGKHIRATSFRERNDSVSTWYEDTATDAIFDSCCYHTDYQPFSDGPKCVEGRPVRDGEEYLVATLQAVAGDWVGDCSINSYSIEQRKFAAQFWLNTALMEHSSVAAFNLFSLELMHFGAPARLLQKSQKAALDEIQHAQRAFSIAAALSGVALQPVSFPTPPSMSTNLVDFAEKVAREAAVNESLAAILAAVQLREAREPAVRDLLAQIIQDESLHAQLAWETLAWCLHKGGASVYERLQVVFQERIEWDTSTFPEEDIRALGILSQKNARQVIEDSWSHVILPSVRLLFMDYEKAAS